MPAYVANADCRMHNTLFHISFHRGMLHAASKMLLAKQCVTHLARP